MIVVLEWYEIALKCILKTSADKITFSTTKVAQIGLSNTSPEVSRNDHKISTTA